MTRQQAFSKPDKGNRQPVGELNPSSQVENLVSRPIDERATKPALSRSARTPLQAARPQRTGLLIARILAFAAAQPSIRAPMMAMAC